MLSGYWREPIAKAGFGPLSEAESERWVTRTRDQWVANMLSVSSNFRFRGLAPVRSRVANTFFTKSRLSNCRALIFTAIVRSAVIFWLIQVAICLQAVFGRGAVARLFEKLIASAVYDMMKSLSKLFFLGSWRFVGLLFRWMR